MAKIDQSKSRMVKRRGFVSIARKRAVSYHSDRPMPRLICQPWFPVATIPPPRFLIEWL